MIPKVFHRVWIGPNAMPDEFKRYGDTWLKHHPTWDMKLWTNENVTTAYPDLVAACHECRHRSNIHRYEILAKHGGVYVDTDFECRKNIEPLIEGCSFVTAAQLADPDAPGALNPAFFGCTPQHKTAMFLVDALPIAFFAGRKLADAHIRSHFGPLYFTRFVNAALGELDTRILPRALFYPYSWNELNRKDEPFTDAYAVHHWAAKHMFTGRTISAWIDK